MNNLTRQHFFTLLIICFVSIGTVLVALKVSAQVSQVPVNTTQGYQRNDALKGLSGSGSNSGSGNTSGSGGGVSGESQSGGSDASSGSTGGSGVSGGLGEISETNPVGFAGQVNEEFGQLCTVADKEHKNCTKVPLCTIDSMGHKVCYRLLPWDCPNRGKYLKPCTDELEVLINIYKDNQEACSNKYLTLTGSADEENHLIAQCINDVVDSLMPEFEKIFKKYKELAAGEDNSDEDTPQEDTSLALPPSQSLEEINYTKLKNEKGQISDLLIEANQLDGFVDREALGKIVENYKDTQYYGNNSTEQKISEAKQTRSQLESIVNTATEDQDQYRQEQVGKNSSESKTPVTNISSDDVRTVNSDIATKLGLKAIDVELGSSLNEIKIYSPGAIPALKTGEVLVRGPSAVTTGDDIAPSDTSIKDTYYIVSKSDLPDGYVLSGAGEINIGGEQKTDSSFGIPILDDKNIGVYNIMTEESAMTNDKERDGRGVFNFSIDGAFPGGVAPGAIKAVNALVATLTMNDSIMGHVITRSYSNNSEPLLTKFGEYGQSLPKDIPQQQVEEKVYDYVNNNIKYQDPNASSITVAHSLEQAVTCGQGICRDKSVALEYGLEAAGISAARVVSNQHVFVAVLNSNGSVNHYLDPMYYENYVPLQRPSVSSSQIVNNNYNSKKMDNPWKY